MGSGKKQRKSIQNNSKTVHQMTSNTPLNNGNESDYGVFSDPEENVVDCHISQSSENKQEIIIEMPKNENELVKEEEQESNIDLNASLSTASAREKQTNIKTSPVIRSDTVLEVNLEDTKEIDIRVLYNEKSIETLKYKLENDPVYSNKTTHITFFSFIFLSVEIEYACSPSISRLSDISNIIRMIDYIITNHSSTQEVQEYTRNMLEMGIIEHVVRGIIEFNNTRKFDKDSIEELKKCFLQPHNCCYHTEKKSESTDITNKDKTSNDNGSTDITTVTPPISKPNRFLQFWRNLSCCCRCRKNRKNSIILDDKESKTEEVLNTDNINK